MSENAPTLLIVDDNEDNRYTLTHRLKRQGYENLATAENGQQALDLLTQQRFDLVLLDIMMPVMNGYEVLEHIKSDMALRDIPVIMISAVDEMESIVRCIKAGAEDHLPKPFNASLLKARIGACLEKKRLHDRESLYLKQIEVEKKRADDLLHSTLPSAVVHELKTTSAVRPRRFEDVAVMFCDVVGFTRYCDEHEPEEVVSHLQALVTKFEEIAIDNGMEKIKTIGDAFMATAGLFQHIDQPAAASVRTGFAMIDAAGEQEAGWDVRVGIHMGPVVAGVIGQRQYLFDVWGDTVNIAARIVDQADPSSVLVSANVWRNLGDFCRGTTKGLVELRGKGELELIACQRPS
jgi:class 3 adenylate cyclase/CheY-like chemotaxis protein